VREGGPERVAPLQKVLVADLRARSKVYARSNPEEASLETYRATSGTIVCTLSKDELSDTRSAWQKLFRTALLVREEIPGGIRLTFNDGSAEALRQLIEIERECCRWITFELDGPAVAMTAEGDGADAIKAMWVVDSTL
jgi:hypothetical protein